jgi:hypothetical protein
VAVARLLGYRWPQQEADNLVRCADTDGIVCLPAVIGGLWLLCAPTPLGFHDDIEAPVRRLEIDVVRHIDIATPEPIEPEYVPEDIPAYVPAYVSVYLPEYLPEYSPRS